MTEQNVDLVKVFSQVSKTLAKNQQTLNEADSYNHDHGDHMVETFQTITKAMKTKKGGDASQMLQAAAKTLSKKADNGSAQLYSQGLQKAAEQFQGQNVDTKSAMNLLQALLSGGQTPSQQSSQPPAGMGDLLGSMLGGGQSTPQAQAGGGMEDLLGSLLGGGQASPPATQSPSGAGQAGGGMEDLLGSLLGGGQPPSQGSQAPSGAGQGGGDLLGSLLGGLTGSSQQQAGGGLSDGLDIGDVMTAGMAFFQAKQQGKDTMGSLIDAFVAASGMGSSPHRQQSTELVASTFMNALGKR
jgi:hypothetical protein